MKRNSSKKLTIQTQCHSIDRGDPLRKDAHLSMTDLEGRKLVLVADGYRDSQDIEIASQKAIEVFQNTFLQAYTFDNVSVYLQQTVYVIASLLMKDLAFDRQMPKNYTTLSGFLIDTDNTIYTINIGNSRVYLFRDRHLQRLTKDHTKLQEALDRQIITDKESRDLDHSDKLTSVLSYSLTEIKADINKHGNLQNGDVLIAVTDGVHKTLSDKQIEQIIKKKRKSGKLAMLLVTEANNRGSQDNITACVLTS